MARFAGQTVIVTGGSLGVGLATARTFLDEGASVVLIARRPEPLEEGAAALGAPERVMTAAVDVSDLPALAGVVRTAVERFGGVGGLVNNAGLHARGPVEANEPLDLAAMVDVNLRAPIALSGMVLPHFRRAGRGFIVNVASLAGKLPLDGAATYSATKFGLRAFSLAMAEELRGSGISVSVVSPGPISTGFILDHLDEVDDLVFSQAVCSAEDVARMILDCALDGRPERQYPASSGTMATLGYLLPSMRRRIKPLLQRIGRRRKEEIRKQLAGKE